MKNEPAGAHKALLDLIEQQKRLIPFEVKSAAESYLQQELRKIHTAVEHMF